MQSMAKNVSSGKLPVPTSMFTSKSGQLVNYHNRSLVDGGLDEVSLKQQQWQLQEEVKGTVGRKVVPIQEHGVRFTLKFLESK